MKKTLSIFFASAFLLQPLSLLAGTEHNMNGFAWSSKIGWVSFNSKNDHDPDTAGTQESPHNYGVNINDDGTITGYAWSPNAGWIQFGGFDIPWTQHLYYPYPETTFVCPSGSVLAEASEDSLNYPLDLLFNKETYDWDSTTWYWVQPGWSEYKYKKESPRSYTCLFSDGTKRVFPGPTWDINSVESLGVFDYDAQRKGGFNEFAQLTCPFFSEGINLFSQGINQNGIQVGHNCYDCKTVPYGSSGYPFPGHYPQLFFVQDPATNKNNSWQGIVFRAPDYGGRNYRGIFGHSGTYDGLDRRLIDPYCLKGRFLDFNTSYPYNTVYSAGLREYYETSLGYYPGNQGIATDGSLSEVHPASWKYVIPTRDPIFGFYSASAPKNTHVARVGDDGRVFGFAKILNAQNWSESLISLGQEDFEDELRVRGIDVRNAEGLERPWGLKKVGSSLTGWAWGGGGIGWINFGFAVDDKVICETCGVTVGTTTPSTVVLRASQGSRDIDNAQDIVLESSAQLSASIGNLPTGAACELSKESSGGTGFTRVTGLTADRSVSTGSLIAGSYSYKLACSDSAGYEEEDAVSFGVVPAVTLPEFSIGGNDQIRIRFFANSGSDSEGKVISVAPIGLFAGDVKLSIGGISNGSGGGLPSGTSIKYSFDGGATFSDSPERTLGVGESASFMIRLGSRITGACTSDGVPVGCKWYDVTVQATAVGPTPKTKIFRIIQTYTRPGYEEV